MKSTFEIEGAIKALHKKKNELELVFEGAKQKLVTLKHQKELEEADVKRLESESFLTVLLKFTHLYNGQLSKETEEFLKAKFEFEKQEAECNTIKKHIQSIEARIFDAELELKDLGKELDLKKQVIFSLKEQSPERVLYEKMMLKHQNLKQEAIEIEEAKIALNHVLESLKQTIESLKSADQWASFDVLGGGICTDLVKYDKIDQAKTSMEQLSALMKCLNRELLDVSGIPTLAVNEISNSTKQFDIWFDNFFTDLKVKHEIENQLMALRILEEKLFLIDNQLHLKNDKNDSNITAVLESLEHILLEIQSE